MSDQRITQLTKLGQADVAANDVLPIVDVGSSVTKKIEAKDLFQAAADLADASSIDLSKLDQGSVSKLGTAALADDAITAAKMADDSSIVHDSVAPTLNNFEGRGYFNSGSKNLQIWDGNSFRQVVAPTAGIEDLAVTTSKLANGAVDTTKVSPSGLGAAALATDSVTTAKIQNSAVTGAKIADSTITTSKIDAAGLGASAIATNAITTSKVLDKAITAAKLGDDSSTVVIAGAPVGNGAFEGQHWFDTNTSVEYIWNGAAWIRQAAINAITFLDTTPIAFSVAYPNQYSAIITADLNTQPANQVFAGPASGIDAAPTFRDLTPSDLPDATASSKGISQPGTGLGITGGILNHLNTVAPGTYTKVIVDAQGHVSSGSVLLAADVPSLDASKVITGEFSTDRLADNAVTIDKLADYSTASLGEVFPEPSFIGQIHLNPLDRAFFLWDGNVWVPIGISAGQIVLAGTFDAGTPTGIGQVESITPEGLAAGFVVGDPLPASSQGNNRFYFVVSQGGTITSGSAPIATLAPPDIILSVYSSEDPKWVEIDVSAGAGAIAATNVSFVPAGQIGSTSVQSALEEVSSECRNADNITSGVLAVARGGTGVGSYAKGDLLVATGATTLLKLAAGSNGQVLRPNTATATGLEWGSDFVGTVTNVTSSTGALTVATGNTTPALAIRSATTSVNGIVQLSDSISTTSSALAATATAVKTAFDLANAALPRAGGLITGDITLDAGVGIQFEGLTDDGNETRLVAADPTADQVITLPNITGTVITNSDTGTVTSAMIADGTIVDADISPSAAISYSKLVLGSNITNADISPSAAIAGTKVSPNFGSQNVATTGSGSFGAGTFTGDVSLSGTGFLDLPVGTTAQRPASPNSGMVRFNTDIVAFEGHDGTSWKPLGSGAIALAATQVPQNYRTSAYTLVSSDAGKHISITTGGVVINASIFSVGDVFSIYNDSASNQTITQGASVTLRQAGTTSTGNRSLGAYGVATILCVATNTFVISGAGVA